MKEGRLSAQPRGKKQKTINKNSKQQQKKNKKREKVGLNRKGQYFLTKGSHNISKFQFDQESGRRRTTNVDVLPLNYYMLCIYNLLSIYLKTRFCLPICNLAPETKASVVTDHVE